MDNLDVYPLHLHTLDTLTAELLAGRDIPLVDTEITGEVIRLDDAARKIFQWYVRNRTKWARNCMKEDVEAISASLSGAVPSATSVIRPPLQQNLRRLHLQKMRAYRFAGLHRFGDSANGAVPVLEFDFTEPLTLILGKNGSGKTSFASAITWCLTGRVFRSMDQPQVGSDPVEVSIDSNDERLWKMAGVTPLPPKTVLESLPDSNVPIDTWVELTLIDEQGKTHVLTRSLARSTRGGRIEETKPALEALRLHPIAFEIGTRMPGLLPHIRLGTQPSDIGRAVAELTGLAPLRDLAIHAEKAQEKLLKDLPKDREKEIARIDESYNREWKALGDLCRAHVSIAPQDLPIANPAHPDSESRLESLRTHFQTLTSAAFSGARSMLGDSFDESSEAKRNALAKDLPVALSACKPAALSKYRSSRRLGDLKKLTHEEISRIEQLMTDLAEEGAELVRIEKNPEEANRGRLYARVGEWLRESTSDDDSVSACPVCIGTLAGRSDPVTNQSIAEHLDAHRRGSAAHKSLTLARWATDARQRLNDQLPTVIRNELVAKTQPVPHRLMSDDLLEELFREDSFAGPLAALKAATVDVARDLKLGLPPFLVTNRTRLPTEIEALDAQLPAMFARTSHAIAAARWRMSHDQECRAMFTALIGLERADMSPSKEARVARSLVDRLTILGQITSSAEPASAALKIVNALSLELKARRSLEATIAQYAVAAAAIDPLLHLGDLVDRQIEALRLHLHAQTEEWKSHLYQAAYGSTLAPRLGATRIGAEGIVTFQSEYGGVRAPAHTIGNASDLRATLVAFLFSFWEYVLNTRGGLSVLLLDDPQDLFDPDNRRRLANTLPLLVAKGGRPIVTTNDTDHAARIAKFHKVDWREMKPTGPGRPIVAIPPNVTEVDKRRQTFSNDSNQDGHDVAREFVASLRIWLEGQFGDFLSPSAKILVGEPSLSTLIEAFRSRSDQGLEALTGVQCRALSRCKELLPGSPTLDLLNRSHHRTRDTITYGEVDSHAPHLRHIQSLVDSAHDELEMWLRRDESNALAHVANDGLTSSPIAYVARPFSVPIIRDLAAFSRVNIESTIDVEEQPLTQSWFRGRGLYQLGSHNFGFSAPKGSIAIVELAEEPIEDSRLVIACLRDRILARRLISDRANPGVVALSSEAENPLERPPSVFIKTQNARLHKVVGILFSDHPPLIRIKGEAEAINTTGAIDTVDLAFRVRQDSAEPLAVEGQIVLAGKPVQLDQVKVYEGRIVAMETLDGQQILKRVGTAVNGLHNVRYFESIGGRGQSLIAQVGKMPRQVAGIAQVRTIRPILGVLYI
jgi:hypothetical protein